MKSWTILHVDFDVVIDLDKEDKKTMESIVSRPWLSWAGED
jgi:hypothetical protein